MDYAFYIKVCLFSSKQTRSITIVYTVIYWQTKKRRTNYSQLQQNQVFFIKISYEDFHPTPNGCLHKPDMDDLTQNEYLSVTVVNTMVHLLRPHNNNALVFAPRFYLVAGFLNKFESASDRYSLVR